MQAAQVDSDNPFIKPKFDFTKNNSIDHERCDKFIENLRI